MRQREAPFDDPAVQVVPEGPPHERWDGPTGGCGIGEEGLEVLLDYAIQQFGPADTGLVTRFSGGEGHAPQAIGVPAKNPGSHDSGGGLPSPRRWRPRRTSPIQRGLRRPTDVRQRCLTPVVPTRRSRQHARRLRCSASCGGGAQPHYRSCIPRCPGLHLPSRVAGVGRVRRRLTTTPPSRTKAVVRHLLHAEADRDLQRAVREVDETTWSSNFDSLAPVPKDHIMEAANAIHPSAI